MKHRWMQVAFVLAATAAVSGCYGTKIFKGPIHTENTAFAVDTIRADQRKIMAKLTELEDRMNREGEERTSSNAQLSVTLRELEDAVRMLVSRIEDSEQMMNNSVGAAVPAGRARPRPPAIRPSPLPRTPTRTRTAT